MGQRDQLNATFKESNWDEKPVVERDGVKITRVRYEAAYQGDLEGSSVVEAIMTYRTDGSVSYVSMESFSGKLAGELGSLVIESRGEFRDGVAESRGQLVRGAGGGALAELAGEVSQRATHQGPQTASIRLAR